MRAPGRIGAGLALAAATSFALAACGSSGGGSSVTPGSKGTITVASANIPESTLVAHMYADVLEKAGYVVNTRYNLGNRELYLKALGRGEIDLVPEYLSTLTTVLAQESDPNATGPASGDAAKTLAALEPLAAAKGLTAYPYSRAADQNAFAVNADTASRYGLKNLSDLSKSNVVGKLTLGGPPGCPKRPFCQLGLERTYGARFAGFTSLDAGGPLTINAIANGSVGIGLVVSSAGAVASKKLVVLADDKHLQKADNILPLIRTAKASPEIAAALATVDEALTTEALTKLNKKVGVDKDDPSDVAQHFLRDKGII